MKIVQAVDSRENSDRPETGSKTKHNKPHCLQHVVVILYRDVFLILKSSLCDKIHQNQIDKHKKTEQTVAKAEYP